MKAPVRTDPVYRVDNQGGNVGARCFCGGHPEANRRFWCDREAMRAYHMTEPIWCFSCRHVFERASVADPHCLNGSMVGTCGSCQGQWVVSSTIRRGGLSVARAQKVRVSDPWRELASYSPAELFYEAYDEVA